MENNMKTVWFLKGLPGSSKTTWAKEKVISSNCSIKRVNKDDIRNMLDSGKHSKGNEKFVLEIRDLIIVNALSSGKHIIVDDTNFEKKHEEKIREIARLYGAEVKVKFFDVPPEECIKRDLKRPNSVGSDVIWSMYNKYLKPKEKEVEVLKQDSTLPHAICIDIDGTVALNGYRNPFDGTSVDKDKPNNYVIDIVKQYISNPYIKVIFMSGREGNEICTRLTKEWLDKYCEGYDLLFMRKEGDNRKDSIIKKELFENNIKDKYYIRFILDDRLQVCQMWYSLGLPLLRVGDPDANF